MADSIKIGSFDVDVIKVGNANVDAVYVGSTKVYPTVVPSYKLVAQYSDSTEYKVSCNESSTLSSGETTTHTTPMSAMTSAVVGDCVTEIGAGAFRGGSSLTSITIPNSVTTIGVNAFHTVTNMTHIDLPSGITSISDSSFRHMQALTAFTIPTGITSIPTWCFNDCTSLTSITIPSNITVLDTNCFSYCTALKEVHFKSTTAPTIASNAFSNCTSLEKIYIPSCDYYNSYAAKAGISAKTNMIYSEDETNCQPKNYRLKRMFINGVSDTIACNSSSALTQSDVQSGKTRAVLSSSTSGLSEVIIGDCVASVSANAFVYLTVLSSITLSNNVKTIGNYAFYTNRYGSSNRIHDLNLGSGVQTIGDYAFAHIGDAYATNRPQVTIPKSVTSIGSRAFVSGKINNLVFENGGNLNIGEYAFSECSSYSANPISISTNSIRTLSGHSFYNFSGLTSASLSGVTKITGTSQFSMCKDLRTLEIYGTNLTITSYFAGGSNAILSSITLSGISSISNSYGLNQSNSSTRILKILDTTPPSIGTTSISDYNPTVIYVPASAVNTYKSATNWNAYASKIQAIPT